MIFDEFAIHFLQKNVFTFFFSYFSYLELVSVPEIVKGPCRSKNLQKKKINFFFKKKRHRNDTMLMKEGYFGRQCKASLKVLEMVDSLMAYLDLNIKC